MFLLPIFLPSLILCSSFKQYQQPEYRNDAHGNSTYQNSPYPFQRRRFFGTHVYFEQPHLVLGANPPPGYFEQSHNQDQTLVSPPFSEIRQSPSPEHNSLSVNAPAFVPYKERQNLSIDTTFSLPTPLDAAAPSTPLDVSPSTS